MRQTSLDAYNAIKEGGLLRGRQWEVYDALTNHGPCTANELRVNGLAHLPGNANQNVVTRLGELRDKGVVSEVRERKCTVTGMTVIEWEVIPDRLPVKFEKPKHFKCARCNGTGRITEQQAKLL